MRFYKKRRNTLLVATASKRNGGIK
jgi:hypothetical protein